MITLNDSDYDGPTAISIPSDVYDDPYELGCSGASRTYSTTPVPIVNKGTIDGLVRPVLVDTASDDAEADEGHEVDEEATDDGDCEGDGQQEAAGDAVRCAD